MRKYKENDTVIVSGKDLNKMIVMIRTLMDLRPDLNEKLMDFYCYLMSLEPEGKSLDEVVWEQGMSLPSWDN